MQEAHYGRPFIGPSGQLLDRVLRHYGYPRDEVMYTNATLCRPTNNETPSKVAIASCRPRLLHEIAESGVRDIVALGGTATSVLVDDPRTITKLRVGPPKPATRDLVTTDEGSPTRVVPTWHPAYCLRTADAFPSLVTDIGKLTTKSAKWKEPAWKYFDEPEIALAALEGLIAWQDTEQQYKLVVDIEVGIDKDESFDHPNNYDLLAVGLAYAKHKAIVIGEVALKDNIVIEWLKRLFKRSKLIAHNGKFDLAGLYPHMGPLELWGDTMLAHYCLDERAGIHKLKTLGVERLGAPQWDDEIHKYIPRGGNYGDVPRAILYKYNAFDVAVTWDLWELFVSEMEEKSAKERAEWPYPDKEYVSLRDLHDFLIRASNQLMFLELNGIKLDRVYQAELSRTFGKRLDELERKLDLIVSEHKTDEEGVPTQTINPRSPKQLKAYFESQKVILDNTKAETLEKLLRMLIENYGLDRDHSLIQFIETLLTHRRQQKLRSTYVEGLRKRRYRGRVYTTYLLHGTTSGRLASRNPNLQNIVRDKPIRKQFVVSKPENVFVHCDFAQAEGRVITYLAQDEYLRDIFSNPDVDLFNQLTCQLYNIPMDEVTNGSPASKEKRIRTKAFFYGLSYGREAYSIAQEYGMSVREAERSLQEFMSLIPATAAWQARTRDEVLAGKDLVTPFGRRRRFWLINDQNKKDVLNEALSFLPQSTASDICLSALTRVRPRLRGMGFVRLTIHDALVAECHEDRRDEVAAILMEEMAAAGRRFTDYVPFTVDATFGKNWGEL